MTPGDPSMNEGVRIMVADIMASRGNTLGATTLRENEASERRPDREEIDLLRETVAAIRALIDQKPAPPAKALREGIGHLLNIYECDWS